MGNKEGNEDHSEPGGIVGFSNEEPPSTALDVFSAPNCFELT
jgi:hypothetical protein